MGVKGDRYAYQHFALACGWDRDRELLTAFGDNESEALDGFDGVVACIS